MIRIKDPQFMKRTPSGEVLNVASIEQYVIDDRQGRVGSPMDRTQLVWGIERDGAFVPHSYDDPTTTQQVYIDSANSESWHGTIDTLPAHPMGRNLRESVLYMMEAALVKVGRLGEGAEVMDEQ